MDQTWLGYQAGIERSFACSPFSGLGCVTGCFGGLGLLRTFRTVEADRKMFKSANWLAIRTRPQLTLAFVISHTREAISIGVLFGGVCDCCCSSILCSQAMKAEKQDKRKLCKDATVSFYTVFNSRLTRPTPAAQQNLYVYVKVDTSVPFSYELPRINKLMAHHYSNNEYVLLLWGTSI